MKKIAILLSLGVLFTVSCGKNESEFQQVSNVSSTPCVQDALKSSSEITYSWVKPSVTFTDKGVQITQYDFEVSCDFTTVNVTHTFVNGVLNITQQGTPNQANCVCYTDVSYTIEGILQKEVNVIFINGVQVYCYNDDGAYLNDCDSNVIIDKEEYLNVPELRKGTISNIRIEGNDLKLTIADSGCDGRSWKVKLITEELKTIFAQGIHILPQITMKVSFENKEMCEAFIRKEFSFNIECLQVKGYNKVQLDILGESILYEY